MLQEIESSDVGNRLVDACNRSNGRLVLRIWQGGGARWLNLNSNGKAACLLLAICRIIPRGFLTESIAMAVSSAS